MNEAAFFDLDKTVIARASVVAFGRPFYREGLISRRTILRGLYGQLIYLYMGADEAKIARMRASTLALTRGWDQARISAIVEEALEQVIEPIIYAEALELINMHKAAGRVVVIVSASPEEIVTPLSRYLGIERAIASRARIDEQGRYSGEMDFDAFGPAKPAAIRALAAALDIDLDASYAYSDSATDLPMLEIVGHPVAVNPDRELARVAQERGWEIRHFVHPIRIRLRDRVAVPRAGMVAASTATVVVAGVGAAVWWRFNRRPASATDAPSPRPATPAGAMDWMTDAAQSTRSFLAATMPRVTRMASSRSFFMPTTVVRPEGLRSRSVPWGPRPASPPSRGR